MGGVGNFLFGGSKSKQGSQQSSSSTQTSSNQSAQSSGQASATKASNYQKSGNVGYNQAYAPVSAAMTNALGYTQQAGDMMAALLGLPASGFSYNQTPYAPPSSILPAGGAPNPPSLPNLGGMIKQAQQNQPPLPTPPAPPQIVPTPVPGSPTPTTSTTSRTTNIPLISAIMKANDLPAAEVQMREEGGPVQAGKPYVVGEKRPELFVPQTSGMILPQVPGMKDRTGGGGFNILGGRHLNPRQRPPRHGPGNGGIVPPTLPTPPAAPVAPAAPVSTPVNPPPNPTDALNTFSNSAGMDFILGQGQKAISGASAANGVFNSGATGQALVDYGQNIGKTFLGQYMDQLGKLGQLGLGAGSAMTGAGGVNMGQSMGGGSSSSGSIGSSTGYSTGQSSGQSTSSGTSSGKGNSKNGLVPAILG